MHISRANHRLFIFLMGTVLTALLCFAACQPTPPARPGPTPTPVPTLAGPLPAATATIQAHNKFYPLVSGETLPSIMDYLDEIALRVEGEVVQINDLGRFTYVHLRLEGENAPVYLIGLYDSALSRIEFPAVVGAPITVYGIGARPLAVTAELLRPGQTAGDRSPYLQIMFVEPLDNG